MAGPCLLVASNPLLTHSAYAEAGRAQPGHWVCLFYIFPTCNAGRLDKRIPSSPELFPKLHVCTGKYS